VVGIFIDYDHLSMIKEGVCRMNMILERAKGLVSKKEIVLNQIQIEIGEVAIQLKRQAAEIVILKDRYAIHLLSDREDSVQMKVTHLELDSAEQVYFTLFNRLRELKGFLPLVGSKFTGDYNYAEDFGTILNGTKERLVIHTQAGRNCARLHVWTGSILSSLFSSKILGEIRRKVYG
jgi:hypothetical protein